MSYAISRFYVVYANSEELEGYVTDILTDEADEYEVTLINKELD
jgi:hypothetical protein